MLRAFSLSIACVVAIASTGLAQVELKWQIPSSPTSAKTVQKMEQVLTIGPTELPSGQDQTIESTTTPKGKNADGSQVVETKFTAFKSKLQLPGVGELEFDSSKENERPGTQVDFLLDIFDAMAKFKVDTTYDANGVPIKAKVADSVTADLDDQAKELIKEQIDADYLVAAMKKERSTVPSKPVKEGDTWEVTQEARLGGGQTLTITVEYTYEGTTVKDGATLHKIGGEAKKVEYAQDPQAVSPLKVSGSELKVDTSDVAILFDNDRGQIVSKTEEMHIVGSMKFEVGGAELDGKLDLKINNVESVK